MGRRPNYTLKEDEKPMYPAEMRVLKEVGLGRTNGEIAKNLFVSISTIRSHLKSLYRKTKTENRYQLIIFARENYLYGKDINE